MAKVIITFFLALPLAILLIQVAAHSDPYVCICRRLIAFLLLSCLNSVNSIISVRRCKQFRAEWCLHLNGIS